MRIDIDVPGEPVGMGSMRAIARKRKDGSVFAQLIPSASGKHQKELMAWRKSLRKVLGPVKSPEAWQTTDVGLKVVLIFWLPRPKSSRIPYPSKKSSKDVDKLERPVLDELTRAEVWKDDCQVVDIHAVKRWAEVKGRPVPTGVRIVITNMEEGA